jgi:hypothetical protein
MGRSVLLVKSGEGMVVRPKQMAVFAEEANQRFERHLADHLRERHGNLPVHTSTSTMPLKSIEDSDLLALVRECIDKARGWGLTWESSIAAFAVLMFLNGPDFDQQPAIRAELENRAVPADSLPDHVASAVPETVWQQVRADYHGGWQTKLGPGKSK